MRRFPAAVAVAVAAAHAEPKPSTIPAEPDTPETQDDEDGLPVELSAKRGYRSSVPTHLDNGQYRTRIATDHILEVGITALGTKRGGSDAQPGHAGLFAYQVDDSYHRDLDPVTGEHGRKARRTFIGPNLALQYGGEAGWYFNDNTPDPETGISVPGINANRQTGYLKARFSTDRNSNGALYSIEPHAVFERTQIKVTGEPESIDRGMTGMISVGVAAMGL